MRQRLLDMRKIRAVASYQFGLGVGEAFFPENVKVTHSKRTGRIRLVFLEGELLATLRPRDGLFSLTISGAKRLKSILNPPRFRVVVQKDVESLITDGRNVFARHVIAADSEVRPLEEVIVTDQHDRVLAVGRALLTGQEMLVFKRGVAVKIRRGAAEE